MSFPERVLKGLWMTEKATALTAKGQYTFEVYPHTSSFEISKAVAEKFQVHVRRVNVLNRSGKWKRDRSKRGRYGRSVSRRLAYVSLREGETIDLV
ncbi:MAG: 50S ribosomal protein L23 [Puniceicoccales bacterium]|nr:50S ribosomal protein L23 [Puniceicoccales bacterium]